MPRMQSEAAFIAPEIDVPSVTAATAMPDPMIARMSAYSAAEAPLSSRQNLLRKFFMTNPRPMLSLLLDGNDSRPAGASMETFSTPE